MSVPMSKEDQAKYWKNQEAITATQKLPSKLPAVSEDQRQVIPVRDRFGERLLIKDRRGNVQTVRVENGLFEDSCNKCGTSWITRKPVKECPECAPKAVSEDGIGSEARTLSDDDKGFIKGAAWGIALATRHHIGSDQMLMESGIPLKDFIAAGVLEHDLMIIRKLFKETR